MSLHPIIRDTRRSLYCGPTAICAVTGLPASAVLAAIDAYRGDAGKNAAGKINGVRGMHIGEVIAVLNRLGFKVFRRRCHDEPTLAAHLRELAERPQLTWAMRIVRIRGHFLAVGPGGADVCDTETKQPVPAAKAPKRRARVTDELIIYARP